MNLLVTQRGLSLTETSDDQRDPHPPPPWYYGTERWELQRETCGDAWRTEWTEGEGETQKGL